MLPKQRTRVRLAVLSRVVLAITYPPVVIGVFFSVAFTMHIVAVQVPAWYDDLYEVGRAYAVTTSAAWVAATFALLYLSPSKAALGVASLTALVSTVAAIADVVRFSQLLPSAVVAACGTISIATIAFEARRNLRTA